MSLIIFILGILGLIAIDQYTKYLTVLNLKDNAGFSIIKDVFELSYVENKGAAFGLLQDKRWFFIVFTIIIIIMIIYYYVKLPNHKKYLPLRFTFALFIAGAIGNLIDRIRLGYVVDMFYFKLIDFPVFNVADSYVVVGSIILVLLVLFKYKDEDFVFTKNGVQN